jgi:hypothetical protein
MIPGCTFHVYNHANGYENLFRENDNYRYFLVLYKKHIQPIANTVAHCLLPSHFHLMIHIKDVDELPEEFFSASGTRENGPGDVPERYNNKSAESKLIENKLSKHFSNLFSAYTQAYNKRYNRRGSLFLKNFKHKPIDSLSQWQTTFLYIHLNPVKHLMVREVEMWNWSSWNTYRQPEKSSLVWRKAALEYFGTFENMYHCMKDKKHEILALLLDE